jgi:hypothetical protein
MEEASKLEVWEVCNQLGGGQASTLASSPELSYMRCDVHVSLILGPNSE